MLDLLPPQDPRVIRCRQDLRLINWLMGNHRWIIRSLGRHLPLAEGGVVEIGAGDGRLLCRLHRRWPDLPLEGFDVAPRPDNLPAGIDWHPGDLLQGEQPWPGAVLIGNLVLHHFAREQLQALGRRMRDFKVILINESRRDHDVLRRSRWLHPLLGEMTRHDMRVSLEAGFLDGELPEWLGLDSDQWEIRESNNIFGAHRLLAVRRS